ncbi:hypothetical protein [Rhizobium rhizogenes]|uniref:hypothetical protein n=1 Tax=Rhizobium rhizogenes TaxID=359 RepID=UPI001573F33D|nr:hypothetical protein [Rhizobium rhizogenes]NTF69595.1 hypothetical protein [Rhizobium rhizogenes]
MTKKADLPSALDIAVARRALGLCTGISGGALNVGFALLEHFNRKTGQCDPSVVRLATMLGLAEATIKRATKELCDVHKLFQKSSHGGLSNRASYRPNWGRMRSMIAAWDKRMVTGSPPESDEAKVSKVSCSTAQNRAVEGIKNEPLTYWNKPIGINLNTDGACGDMSFPDPDGGETSPTSEPVESTKGLGKEPRGEPVAQLPRVVDGKNMRVAKEAAGRRWNSAMLRRGSGAYSRFVDWVTEAHSDTATAAEMRRRGDGERYLVEQMLRDGVVTRDA